MDTLELTFRYIHLSMGSHAQSSLLTDSQLYLPTQVYIHPFTDLAIDVLVLIDALFPGYGVTACIVNQHDVLHPDYCDMVDWTTDT